MRKRSTRSHTPTTRHETPYWAKGHLVAGIDEVGRGAGAGPVVHACVVLDHSKPIPPVRDSKTLTTAARQRLADAVHAQALAVGIGMASPGEVDTMGLSTALQRSAQRAVVAATETLGAPIPALLVDGNWDFCPFFDGEVTLLTRGDRASVSIAAASIVAKVHRDALLCELATHYPGYGLEANKGYLTPSHLDAIRTLGPSPIHRMSWAPMQNLSLF